MITIGIWSKADRLRFYAPANPDHVSHSAVNLQGTDSYFEGGELASSGLPEGLELEILEEFRSDLPDEVFTTPYENPVNGDRDARRANQRIAAGLLREAGWRPEGGQWVNEAGEPIGTLHVGRSACVYG